MKTNNPTPKCPYCGAEMKPDRTFKSMLPVGTPATFWWMCGECGATSPKRETGEFAYAAAMRRYEEPVRVLTLNEMLALDGDEIVWHEWRSGGLVRLFRDELSTEDEPKARENYGKVARCWNHRPTDAERKASPWKN